MVSKTKVRACFVTSIICTSQIALLLLFSFLIFADMVLTEHYIVLKINALEMDQMAFLTGAKGPAESLGMDGRGE